MLHIIPASHGKEREAMALPGSKVLLKAGRGVLRVREELRESGQLENAALVERCGMEGERLVYDMDELREPSGYFSIILVKEERRGFTLSVQVRVRPTSSRCAAQSCSERRTLSFTRVRSSIRRCWTTQSPAARFTTARR